MVAGAGPISLGALLFVTGASVWHQVWRQIVEITAPPAPPPPSTGWQVTQQCAREITCPDCLCSCSPVFYPSSDNFSSWVWPECGIRGPKVLSLLMCSYAIVILSTVVIMRFYLRPTLIRSFAFPPRPLSPRTPSESSSVPTLRVTAPSDSPVTRRPGVVTPKSRR